MLALLHVSHADIAMRLALAVGLGTIVGIERELSEHIAGLRTHALVALGAATFGVLSTSGTLSDDRIAAQVVTGIGFLGAGAILREGLTIRGLTTAAAIWAAAAIGLSSGMGRMLLATATTGFVLLVLVVYRQLELRRRGLRNATVVAKVGTPGAARALLNALQAWPDCDLALVTTTPNPSGELVVEAAVRHRVRKTGDIVAALSAVDDVRSVEWLT